MFKKGFFSLLIAFIASFLMATPASAGTDLTVSCPSVGSCGVTPAGTPIFEEFGWMPGSTVTQRLTMDNTSGQSGFAAMEVVNYDELKNLGHIVQIEIRRDSPVGAVVYGGVTLHQFRDDGYFTFDTLTSGQTKDYYLTAYMPASAGNEYQAARAEFDLNMGLELTPIPPTSGGGDGEGNPGGSVLGSNSGPAPVCTANAPGSAPTVTITSVGVNTVSLSWTAVSPVTHYALVFTRTSDGAQYGSTNIGNVTTYTITNLSGGAGYTFEVFGVNDCAPGPRGTATSGIVGGPVIDTRPLGPGGEVLGVEEDLEASPSPTPNAESENSGQIAGVFDDVCAQWRQYIPWLLLIAQLVIILFAEWKWRADQGWTKHFVTVGMTLLSIALFYLLRECDCYAGGFLAWLCKWYWVVAGLMTLLLRVISYAFIEEVEAGEESKIKN
ncbi:MAG TPA: fibronectin type III domain-containing protein [Patescibacteria group bacterium]